MKFPDGFFLRRPCQGRKSGRHAGTQQRRRTCFQKCPSAYFHFQFLIQRYPELIKGACEFFR
jgi:hypothetical protein